MRRGPRGAPQARNLSQPVTVRFVGDPVGYALTRATFDHDAPGMSGEAGHVYAGELGCAERTFNGTIASPQPALDSGGVLAVAGGTRAVYRNGPDDYSSMPSGAAGDVFLDARARALATQVASR
jgi:hypothetical protein